MKFLYTWLWKFHTYMYMYVWNMYMYTCMYTCTCRFLHFQGLEEIKMFQLQTKKGYMYIRWWVDELHVNLKSTNISFSAVNIWFSTAVISMLSSLLLQPAVFLAVQSCSALISTHVVGSLLHYPSCKKTNHSHQRILCSIKWHVTN